MQKQLVQTTQLFCCCCSVSHSYIALLTLNWLNLSCVLSWHNWTHTSVAFMMICIVTHKSCTERITNFLLPTSTCTVRSSSTTFRMNEYTVSQRWEKVAILNSTAAQGFEQMRFCHCLWKAQFSPACIKVRACHFHIHRGDAGPKRWAFTFIWLIGLCECVKKMKWRDSVLRAFVSFEW